MIFKKQGTEKALTRPLDVSLKGKDAVRRDRLFTVVIQSANFASVTCKYKPTALAGSSRLQTHV